MTTLAFDWDAYTRRPEVFRTLRRRVRAHGIMIVRHRPGTVGPLGGRYSTLEVSDPALVEEFVRRGPDR